MEQQLIYLPKELRKRAKIAAVNEKSLSAFIQKAIKFYLAFLDKDKEAA